MSIPERLDTETPATPRKLKAPHEAVPSPNEASARLQPRDRLILVALANVAYMTTRQIARLAGFTAERRARRRMAELRDLGLVNLVAKGARGAVNPAWCLSKRGEKVVPVFDAPLHYRALSLGAPLLGLVLAVSGLYAKIVSDDEDETLAWQLLPDLRWSDQSKAKGVRAPHPWAVLTLDGTKIAVELDRPARRRADIEAVIQRWAKWRSVEVGWGDAVVLYVVPAGSRVATVSEVIGAREWFLVSVDPASQLGLGGES